MNEDALRAIARMALERKTGARGLRSIMVSDISFISKWYIVSINRSAVIYHVVCVFFVFFFFS